VSFPFFSLECESQEWLAKHLIFFEEKPFEILFLGTSARLRKCSIEGEQNALSRGIRGPETETAAIRLTRARPSRKRRDAVGILRLAKSSSSECHGAA
jgi:hypothetical protein